MRVAFARVEGQDHGHRSVLRDTNPLACILLATSGRRV